MPATRGRAACNGCRSRKQKCDEKKPVCSRCQASNYTCVWPRPQKRGPAKGYMEALEHRLEATEAALLRLVSVSNKETIEAAFQSPVPRPLFSQRNEETNSSGTEPRKASILELWEHNPLETPQELLAWATEAQHRGGFNEGIYASGHRMPQHDNLEIHENEDISHDDSLLASQLHAAELENSPPHAAHRAQDGQLPSSPGVDNSTLDVPLDFQRIYVW